MTWVYNGQLTSRFVELLHITYIYIYILTLELFSISVRPNIKRFFTFLSLMQFEYSLREMDVIRIYSLIFRVKTVRFMHCSQVANSDESRVFGYFG